MSEYDPLVKFEVDHRVDARGLVCPEPLMLLQQVVSKAHSGERVLLLATDQTTERDVVHFCHFLGHTLKEQLTEGELYFFVVEKH